MKYAFVLSKENLDIAKEEVLTLVNTTDYNLIKNVLIIEIKNTNIIKKLAKRLAYTNSICALLFKSDYGNFLKNMEDFDWDSVYKDNFCIRINYLDKEFKKGYSEKELAGYVWRKVKSPEVRLKDSKTHIEVFFTKNKIYCCLLLDKLSHGFTKRRSHLRPKPSPISLHPKLARAMVNLTGAEENEIILDPFCGSGGILIEAGLIGMKTIGYDINKKMVWKSMVNIKHYNIKNCTFAVKDFFKINKKYRYIVSDLPYGLNTTIMENIRVTKHNKKQLKKYLVEFYSKVANKLGRILIKRAVIIFPSYINYKQIIKSSKLKLKNEFESYVHSNLTRKIVVLEK